MREFFDGLEYLQDYASVDEITSTWLLNQVLPDAGGKLKITEIDDETVALFLNRLADMRLMMPDGRHSLDWLDERWKLRLSQAEGKRGEQWERVRVRLRYVLAKLAALISRLDPDDLKPQAQDDNRQDGDGLIVETG